LEEDGTLIDDDEVLIELHSKTFVILSPTEEWTPPMPFQPVIQPQSSAVRPTVSYTQSSDASLPSVDESVPSISATATAASPDCRGSKHNIFVTFRQGVCKYEVFDDQIRVDITVLLPAALRVAQTAVI